MRLQLSISRNKLPTTEILWVIPAGQLNPGTTISRFLAAVDEIVPLEADEWGLDDYVVELDGFECLHFQTVVDVLKPGDHVRIRPLQTSEVRARKLSGRYQISYNGQHLIDGVPYGRTHFRHARRPRLMIPARRDKIMTHDIAQAEYMHDASRPDAAVTLEDCYISQTESQERPGSLELVQSTSVHGTAQPRRGRFETSDESAKSTLALFADDDDEDEDDEDFIPDSEQLVHHASTSENEVDRGRRQRRVECVAAGSPPVSRQKKNHVRSAKNAVAANPTGQSGKKSGLRVAFVDASSSSNPAPVMSSNSSSSSTSDSILDSDPEPSLGRGHEHDGSDTGTSSTSTCSDSNSDSDSDSDSTSDTDTDPHSVSESSSDTGPEEYKHIHSPVTKPIPLTSNHSDRPITIASKSPQLLTTKRSPPGQGLAKTQSRNQRRRKKRQLEALIRTSALPEGSTTADLQAWQAQHDQSDSAIQNDQLATGQATASIVSSQQLAKKTDELNKRNADLEARRQKLLHSLAHGAVDIETLEPLIEQVPMSQGMPKRKAEAVDHTSTPTNKQRKLDLGSSQRLILGSLGVQTPRTEADVQRIRAKLVPPASKKHTISADLHQQPEPEPESEPEPHSDTWRSHLVLSAVECVGDNSEFAEPPYPFVQWWHSSQTPSSRRRAKKNHQSTITNQADRFQNSTIPTHATDSHVVLDYDEKSAPPMQDLEALPSDMGQLQQAKVENLVPGSVIAFKQLDLGESTNWQPMISEYKTARVDMVIEPPDVFSLTLAARDIPAKIVTYDWRGIPITSKFILEDDDEPEDTGVRMIAFGELIEPKIISMPVNSESCHDQRGDGEAVKM